MTDWTATDTKRVKAALLIVTLCAVFAASGGPLQVYLSKFFWCGRGGSGLEIHYLMAIAAVQVVLYLFGQYSIRASRVYGATQWLGLFVCAGQIVLLAQAYPTTFSFFGLTWIVGFGLAALALALSSPEGLRELRKAEFWSHAPYLASIGALLTVAWLVTSGLIAQFFLYRPATPLTALPLTFCLVAGALIAAAACWTFHKRNYESLRGLHLAAFPPLFVLLLALLRAKYPDFASDTFAYKGTWPYQIAEWRTAATAVVDVSGLGSNFQEMFNGLLLVLIGDYYPSLISTLSVLALFALLPCCINLADKPFGILRLSYALATATIVCLSEPALAQGTAYQETLIALLLTLGLLNVWIWPIFAAAAIATKLTAVFAVPLLFVIHYLPADRLVAGLWRQRTAIVGACVLIAVFVAPQIDRNLIYTGRVTGVTEGLARLTDPAGPTAMLSPGPSLHPASPRGGILSNLVLSACNSFALEVFCPFDYKATDGYGFHIIPSSRVQLAGLILALAAIVLAVVSRARSTIAVVGALIYVVSFLGFLSQVAQGRYFVVPAFTFAPLLICVAPTLAKAWATDRFSGRRMAASWIFLLAIIPIGDLLVGVYMNNSWECRRPFFARAETLSFDRPQNETERFIAGLAAGYRKICPPPGLPPTVVVLHGAMQSQYLGMNTSITGYSHELSRRYFEVDPAREKNIPVAIAAVVLKDTRDLKYATRSQEGQYAMCFESKDVKVYCSKQLAPTGAMCAKSTFDGVVLTRVK